MKRVNNTNKNISARVIGINLDPRLSGFTESF
jgi:hypothetical protein